MGWATNVGNRIRTLPDPTWKGLGAWAVAAAVTGTASEPLLLRVAAGLVTGCIAALTPLARADTANPGVERAPRAPSAASGREDAELAESVAEEVSDGEAEAVPRPKPPKTAPTPRATANPPTRPTKADALILLDPPTHHLGGPTGRQTEYSSAAAKNPNPPVMIAQLLLSLLVLTVCRLVKAVA